MLICLLAWVLLRPAEPALLDDLNDDRFRVREAASRRLAGLPVGRIWGTAALSRRIELPPEAKERVEVEFYRVIVGWADVVDDAIEAVIETPASEDGG